MAGDMKDQVKASLDKIRPHIDELRVKAHLLRMELRDKQDDVVDDIEDAYKVTKTKLKEYLAAGEETADEAGQSLKSAWERLKKKIHDATADD